MTEVRLFASPAVSGGAFLTVGDGTLAAQRGNRRRPNTRRSHRSTTFRIRTRRCGTGDRCHPAGRGIGSAVPWMSRQHIWAGDRCGTNSCAGSKVIQSSSWIRAGRSSQASAPDRSWPHGRTSTARATLDRRRSRGQRRRFKKFRCRGQRPPVTKFSRRARCCWYWASRRGRQPATHFTSRTTFWWRPTAVSSSRVAQRAVPGKPIHRHRSAASLSSPRRQVHQELRRVGYGTANSRSAFAGMDPGRLFVADLGNRRIQISTRRKHSHCNSSAHQRAYIDRNDSCTRSTRSRRELQPGRGGLRVGNAKTARCVFRAGARFQVPRRMGGRIDGRRRAVDGQGNVYAGEVGRSKD